MKTQCQKCKTSNVIFRCGNAICTECGHEITVDHYFANLMANGILAQKADGLDRTEWLERVVTAYLSASTHDDGGKLLCKNRGELLSLVSREDFERTRSAGQAEGR